ncbi:MAG TPA: APH(3') family aminoglycoside O-phosphotransferase [Pyrinomonadaceae bacterium]|jgi:aminoglycoside phosphotransferase
MTLARIKKLLPAPIAEKISGYRWQENKIGFSCVKIFRLTTRNKQSLYLKINPRASKFSLFQEKLRLEWLKNRIPVPEVALFAEDERAEYLLQAEIPGVSAIDDSLKTDIPCVIEELVLGLKKIHALPTENCPFDMRLAPRIETARERTQKGQVEEEDFDEERQGRTAAEIFQEMLKTRPTDEDLVFTHGDCCMPNVVIKNKKLSGFVDWAEAGVADRYQDLALLSRSVRYNFGEQYEKSVFELYGIEPDWKKINFYRLLDEFF